MNTPEIVSAVIGGSAVLCTGTVCATARSAFSRGYGVTFTAPGLRFEPLRLPALAAAEAVTGPVEPGDAMTRKRAAELLKVGEREIRALGKSGVLREIPQGGRSTLVTASSVDRLLAARLAPEAPEATP